MCISLGNTDLSDITTQQVINFGTGIVTTTLLIRNNVCMLQISGNPDRQLVAGSEYEIGTVPESARPYMINYIPMLEYTYSALTHFRIDTNKIYIGFDKTIPAGGGVLARFTWVH